jgi:GrpB-like predicted nucleotidyltransferase (UPF0157 family)
MGLTAGAAVEHCGGMQGHEPRLTPEEELVAITVGPLERLDGPVTLVESSPEWPALFDREAARIRQALGNRAVLVEHVGSTAVPGLAAKPIIDIALVVPDSGDESAYVPALEAVGYRMRIRTPEWEEHRMLKGPDTDVNLHVFSPGSNEVQRLVSFRDHLRADAADRGRYAAEKHHLAERRWAYMQHYADAKTRVVEDILAGGRRTRSDRD